MGAEAEMEAAGSMIAILLLATWRTCRHREILNIPDIDRSNVGRESC